MIKKVVIPAAGLGTRLLPITKELPKEMLPVFFRKNKKLCLRPMLQAVFEQIYDVGFREFGFIVGRGKRAIEDHFTFDENFVEKLKHRNKSELANGLQEFYTKLNNSTIIFINQPVPKGFGDAIHKAKPFTVNDPFLIHAGDDFIFSEKNTHLQRIIDTFENHDADAAFFVEEVADSRKYGVIVGNEIEPDLYSVKQIIEKPENPPSNLAVVAIYLFKPIIYKAIEQIKPDKRGEIQLTDSLQLLLSWGCKMYAIKLESDERRIDIGTPESYLKTLRTFDSIKIFERD
jgi:UTP--glucose-1-phosphate uridylyltransferase